MEFLSKLFGSSARVKLLRLFMFNKDKAFTAHEVAERSKLTIETARKEIAYLSAAGVLKRSGKGSVVRYQTNMRMENIDALDVFIRETTTVNPARMLDVLRRSGTLRVVALSGIFTGSDQARIDLLVVGDALDERVLGSSVHTLEAELGREIRYAAFSTPDFRYRMGVYDRLLRDVFDYPHRLLVDKIGL